MLETASVIAKPRIGGCLRCPLFLATSVSLPFLLESTRYPDLGFLSPLLPEYVKQLVFHSLALCNYLTAWNVGNWRYRSQYKSLYIGIFNYKKTYLRCPSSGSRPAAQLHRLA